MIITVTYELEHIRGAAHEPGPRKKEIINSQEMKIWHMFYLKGWCVFTNKDPLETPCEALLEVNLWGVLSRRQSHYYDVMERQH